MSSKLVFGSRVWKILFVLFVLLIAFGLVHWFLYLTVIRSFVDGSIDIKLLGDWEIFIKALPFIYSIGLLSMPIGFLCSRSPENKYSWITWFGYIWMGFFTIHLFFSTIDFGISFFYQHPYSYWILIATLIISIWSLYKGMKFPDLVFHKISGTPRIQGFKIAQISDLHIGMLHLNHRWLDKVINKINEAQPDIVVITGDLVEGHFEVVSKMIVSISKLKAPLGIYYITGNHEYIHPGDWEKYLSTLGVTVLHNQNKIIDYNGQKILVAGVPDKMVSRFTKESVSKPDVALHSSIPVEYKILLAHQPASAFDIKNENCDLLLTGHTHGGQIFPFHFAVLLQQPMFRGFKKIGKTLVFNHQGTGFWGPPMRWFSRSEIVIIEMK